MIMVVLVLRSMVPVMVMGIGMLFQNKIFSIQRKLSVVR